MSEEEHELNDEEKEEEEGDKLIDLLARDELEAPKEKNNYIFIFAVYLIHALIAMGFYFICYKYNFTIDMYQSDITDDSPISDKIIDGFKSAKFFFTSKPCLYSFLSLVILFGSIYILSTKDDSCKSEKCQTIINYTLFIFINLYKLSFKIFFYLNLIYIKKNNEIDFSHFEARMYWKISMGFINLFLIIYCYFRKNEKPTKKGLLLISVLPLIVLLILLITTQKPGDNYIRISSYTLYYVCEIILLFVAIFSEEKFYKGFLKLGIILKWRIHRIDVIFYLIFPFIMVGKFVLLIIQILYISCKRTTN